MTTEGTFRTHDALHLYRRTWPTDGPARADVALVHGYAEHSGRHARLAGWLNAEGCTVHSFDLRGHGRSEGAPVYVDRFGQYVADLQRFLEVVVPTPRSRPLFLLGHSMGGTIATRYALDAPEALDGLVLSSPALKVSDDVAPLLQRAAGFLGRWLPRLPTIALDRTLLSRDPVAVADAESDPLNYHGRLPARTGAELLRATQQLATRLDALHLPVLCVHGTADGLTDPEGSKALYREAPSTDKTLVLLPGLYHETFNEPEHERVRRALTDWLAERLPESDRA